MCSPRTEVHHSRRRSVVLASVRLVTTAQAVVDRHIHFWDTDRFDYPWLQGFTEPNEPLPTATEEVLF
jgi:hypothetical protein